MNRSHVHVRSSCRARIIAMAATAALCSGSILHAALQVGSAGLPVQTFGSLPPTSEWTVLAVGSSAGTYTTAEAMDAAVIANTDASAVTGALTGNGTQPPAQNATPRWNSSGLYLQTRTTGNDYQVLMATLQNVSGGNLPTITVGYDWAQRNPIPVNEDIPGHRVYYSTTGTAGSWTLIPEFSTFTVNDENLSLAATLNLGTWANNDMLYIIWVDDNGPGSTTNPQEGGYSIDNFSVTIPGVPPSIQTPPSSQTVLQCRTATFTVAAAGSLPLSYQWYFNNSAIPGATDSTYTIPSVQAGDAGNYHVVVTNPSGSTPSAAATLTVTPDTQAPVALYAIGQSDGTTIRLTFNEPVAADVAAATFNYEMYVVGNSNSPTDVSSAVVENETNVVLTTEIPRIAGQNYFLRIHGRKDACAANESFTPVDVHIVQLVELLSVDGVTTTWRYNEQNIDLAGTGWQNLAYDDNDWLTGLSVLTQTGGEPGEPAGWVISPVLTAQNAGGPETTYFRSAFNLPTTPGSVTVQFTHWIDDGAVFFVNGTEVGRVRMAAGAYTHATDGTSPAEPHPEEGPIVVPSSALFGGGNVMAVEVHQSGTGSSDVAMGVKMVAYVTNYSSGLRIATQPQDQTVNEGQPASLSVTADGAVPFTYQWRKGGTPIPGATTPVLDFPSALPSDTGDYDVIITNPVGTTNSRVARLTVVADTTAPTILRALGNVDLTTFRITFSEPMDEASAEDTLRYLINQVDGGGDLAITSATLTDGTNLVLVTQDPRVQGVNYEIQVFDVYDQSVAQNPVTPSSFRIASGIAVVTPDDVTLWQYDQNGVDFTGNGWNTAGFDASTWPVGFAGFSTPTPEIVPAGFELRTTALVAQPNGGPKTVYFRVPFDFAGSLSGAHLEAVGVIDDGAVFYINGNEAGRIRIAAGPVTFTTDASTAPETSESHPAENVTLSTAGVQATGNLLAVELHQSGTASSDSILSIQLVAYVTEFGSTPTGPRMTISRNATTGQITITWPGGGTLQSSPVVGPGATWTAIPGASSPFTFTPSGDQGFFRVLQ